MLEHLPSAALIGYAAGSLAAPVAYRYRTRKARAAEFRKFIERHLPDSPRPALGSPAYKFNDWYQDQHARRSALEHLKNLEQWWRPCD